MHQQLDVHVGTVAMLTISFITHHEDSMSNCWQNKLHDVSVLPTSKQMVHINQSKHALSLRYVIINFDLWFCVLLFSLEGGGGISE